MTSLIASDQARGPVGGAHGFEWEVRSLKMMRTENVSQFPWGSQYHIDDKGLAGKNRSLLYKENTGLKPLLKGMGIRMMETWAIVLCSKDRSFSVCGTMKCHLEMLENQGTTEKGPNLGIGMLIIKTVSKFYRHFLIKIWEMQIYSD